MDAGRGRTITSGWSWLGRSHAGRRVLLLDEATSALHTVTPGPRSNGARQHRRHDRHPLSTAGRADTSVVMDGGQTVGKGAGTRSELLAHGGFHRKLPCASR